MSDTKLVTWSPQGGVLHDLAHGNKTTMCNTPRSESWGEAPWDSPLVPGFVHCTKCQLANKQRREILAADTTFADREEHRGKAVRTPVFIQMCAECPDCGAVAAVTSSPGPRSLAVDCPAADCPRVGAVVLSEGRYCVDWEAVE